MPPCHFGSRPKLGLIRLTFFCDIFSPAFKSFTAFETSENNLFLVNRGWVSKEDFNYEEGTETYQEKVSIQGVLSPFKRFGLNLVNQTYLDDWPKLVQQVDYETTKNDIGDSINKSS